MMLLFAGIHAAAKGATVLSVCSTAMEAGFVLSAVYIFSSNLWLPIFLHFACECAAPDIFGGFTPGLTIDKTGLLCTIKGTI